MNRTVSRSLVSLLLAVFLAGPAAGVVLCDPQDLEGEIAAGPPEDLLASIQIPGDSMTRLRGDFGKPASRILMSFDETRGEAQYLWPKKKKATLIVISTYEKDGGDQIVDREVVSAEISAPPDHQSVWATGRQVGLGASRRKVEATYGPIYTAEEVDGRERLIYCFENGNTLEFTLNAAGTVERIRLAGPPS
ncbi:MAG TPA: hypothetical protein VJ725_12280 [Thermoanaerobaculia bacterium]|nr:hypothetical protein [Thermoanaerobaculia bacterium]